jgi:uncharacterized protein
LEQASETSVRSIDARGITVGSEIISSNVILLPETIVKDWPVKSVADLVIEDFTSALDANCNVIVLGTGNQSLFPPRALLFALARLGIGLETMDTNAACRTFNILISEGRRAAAALFINAEE